MTIHRSSLPASCALLAPVLAPALRVMALALALVLSSAASWAGPPPSGAFPYPITTERLENGLTLLVVPFDSPGVVSYYTLVRAGSRNEVEAGRTGYAHFFEHMMFRGTKKWPEARRRDFIASTGSDDNGWTTDDYTCYPVTTQSARLGELIAEEADRFQNLSYDERQFRTESKAILGEYFKNISNPEAKLFEVLRQTAYSAHTYRHTTMGVVEDIRAMPEGYEYSRVFFDRFYTPANTTVIVVGDVDPSEVRALVRRHYGKWKKAGAPPAVTAEPLQKGERRANVEWETQTLPRVAVSWHVPAGTSVREIAALRILEPALLGESSALYKDLVLERKLAQRLTTEVESLRDPGLFTVIARVSRAADVPAVEQAIEAALESFSAASLTGSALTSARLRLRYEFLLSLSSAPRIAGTLASGTSLTGDPRMIDAYYDAIASVSPDEIARAARAAFRPENRTVVTLLARGAGDSAAASDADGAAESASRDLADVATAARAIPMVEMRREPEPTVAVRLAFKGGSTSDPPGREGLTFLMARTIAEGGSRAHSAEEINRLLEPTGTALRFDVDKETTSFYGRVHRDHAALFVTFLAERLVSPRFDPADVERTRRAALDDVRSRLRNNDDENLGKEVLALTLYPPPSPWHHFIGGTVRGLESITIEDLRRQASEVLRPDCVTIGLAGGATDELTRRLRSAVATLGTSGEANGRDGVRAAPSSSTGALVVSVTEASMGRDDAPAVFGSNSGKRHGVKARSERTADRPADAPDAAIRSAAAAIEGAAEVISKVPSTRPSRLVLVRKPTDSTAISIGFPLDVKRGDPDFPALALAASYFGEHRQFVGRLQKRMRILRGLNYGNYAYTEFFRQEAGSLYPAAGTARSSQFFSIWIRPVSPENGLFALREAVYELRTLLKEGIPPAEFQKMRDYVVGFSRLKEQTLERRLGMAIDDRAYGLEGYADTLRAAWRGLTVDAVNDAIRRHWRADGLTMVMVLRDPDPIVEALRSRAPATIAYASPMPKDVTDEDVLIGVTDLGLPSDGITVVAPEDLFEE